MIILGLMNGNFFKKLIKNNDFSSNNEGLHNMIFVNKVNKK